VNTPKINTITLFAGIIFLFLANKAFCDENNIPSLKSQSWDIAQCPEIAIHQIAPFQEVQVLHVLKVYSLA
jgi:hypothetical protein